MRELPILLNGHGVRATMEEHKTMTRRPIRDVCPWVTKIEHVGGDDYPWLLSDGGNRYAGYDRNPLGVPGDLLYVRETWAALASFSDCRRIGIAYRANGEFAPDTLVYPRDVPIDFSWSKALSYRGRRWRPSIHMPKWAARLRVRNTGVRVERVQDIAPADCEAEGIEGKTLSAPGCGKPYGEYTNGDGLTYTYPRIAFAALWDSIYNKRGLGWDANPWVWVTSYEVTER